MRALTAEEIRAALEASAIKFSTSGREKLEEAIGEYPDVLRWVAPDTDSPPDSVDGSEEGTSLWRDLRPTEDRRLRELLYQAEVRAVASCHELIVSEYTVALHAFAAEHPDAPRATRDLATA